AVGGVLARGVGELLDRLDGMVEQHLLPAAKVGFGPVAIDAPDAGHAVFGYFLEQSFDNGRRRVVGVDENGEEFLLVRGAGFAGHGSSLKEKVMTITPAPCCWPVAPVPIFDRREMAQFSDDHSAATYRASMNGRKTASAK